MPQNKPHVCHAIGCSTACKPEHLMCPKHWKMVNSDLQNKIYQHYRVGQCGDKSPSKEWMKFAYDAVKEVKNKEVKNNA